LGWTRDAVLDQIDIPFLHKLQAEWRVAPPVRIIVSAFAGYKPPAEARLPASAPARKPGDVDLASLKAALGMR
jgi:hypothetical protein